MQPDSLADLENRPMFKPLRGHSPSTEEVGFGGGIIGVLDGERCKLPSRVRSGGQATRRFGDIWSRQTAFLRI